jgi:hypothetical protein
VTGRGALPAVADEWARRGGLLVPVDTAGEPVPALTGPAAELRDQLTSQRDLVAVQREDEWARRASEAEHRIAMADVAERAAVADRARRERARDAQEGEELGQLYRRASRSGERARIRAQIQGSAEMRALRVAKIRSVALMAGIPVLAAFAAWSTTGVQAGVVRLLHLNAGEAMWWASWGMEPALITIVALVIIGRAVLRSSGGDTDGRATVAEWTALGLSLALNIVGGWPAGAGFWAGTATALPHAIGPFGCAGTAFLIGLFDSYVTQARPWENAPRLTDLDLTPPVPVVATVGTPAVPVVPVPGGTGSVRSTGTGTALAAVPARRGSTGPGRVRPAVPAASTGGRRAISARTGTGAVPGERSAKAIAKEFWDAEVAAGRVPTGMDLARAAGRDTDDTGVFRRYAREFAEAAGGDRDAAAS